MTEREMKAMSKAQLMEAMTALTREKDELNERVEKLTAQLKEAREKAASRADALKSAGSIAEASMALNGVFSAAQAAADQYVEEVKRLREETEAACAAMLEETGQKCREMEIGTQRRCDELFRAARDESSRNWSALARQLEDAVHEYVSGTVKQ